jgi:hypothetical protein
MQIFSAPSGRKLADLVLEYAKARDGKNKCHDGRQPADHLDRACEQRGSCDQPTHHQRNSEPGRAPAVTRPLYGQGKDAKFAPLRALAGMVVKAAATVANRAPQSSP